MKLKLDERFKVSSGDKYSILIIGNTSKSAKLMAEKIVYDNNDKWLGAQISRKFCFRITSLDANFSAVARGGIYDFIIIEDLEFHLSNSHKADSISYQIINPILKHYFQRSLFYLGYKYEEFNEVIPKITESINHMVLDFTGELLTSQKLKQNHNEKYFPMSVLIIADQEEIETIMKHICDTYNEEILMQAIGNDYLFLQTKNYEFIGVYPNNAKNPVEQGNELLKGKIELIIIDRFNPIVKNSKDIEEQLGNNRVINYDVLQYFL